MLPYVLALLLLTRALGGAGVLPRTAAERQEIAERSLSPSFHRVADAPADVERWSSPTEGADERCFADFGPAGKIAYGCRFPTAVEGGAFLRSAATALAHPLRPPFPSDAASELHHRALMTIDHNLIGAEFHLVAENDGWTAVVVLTPGRRVVLPLLR